MTILLVQTLLLMLVAFLLGASLACLIRRGFSGGGGAAAAATAAGGVSSLSPAVPPPASVDAAATNRFGRALVGGEGAGVPPLLHGQPVVEVQPPPAAPPAAEVSAQPEPPPAPPQRDALHPEPVAPAPAAEPEPEPEPQPEPAPAAQPEPEARPTSSEQSYTQIAVAAAAAAAALAARAKAEAETEAEDAAAAAVEPEEAVPPAAEQPSSGQSYTQIAAAVAAGASAIEGEAAEDDTRFGTPVAGTSFERPAGEGVDDFTRIRNIDTDLKEQLVRYGVHRFSQIASWTAEDVRGVGAALGVSGRIESENWIEQAAILAAGGDPRGARTRDAAAPAVATAPVDGDRLHRIIGVDPDSESLLRANGVTQLVQIASWTAEDVARFEALIGAPGRIAAESWVEQARFLVGWAPPAPEPEEAGDAPAEADAPVAAAAASSGADYAELRSVRSEALRGDTPLVFTTSDIDDLKRIRGIGVLIEKKLNSLGITSYEQVANWTEADIDRISQVLDFRGRIERENWIEQARILASGGQTEFSRRVDRGEA